VNGKRRPTKSGHFPQTPWVALDALQAAQGRDDLEILNLLAAKYWSPLYQFVLAQGGTEVDAMDSVQDFFAFALQTRLFQKADRRRGRFRSFLLVSLANFLHNTRRREQTQKRRPSAGLTSLDTLVDHGYFHPPALVNRHTPEELFHRTWLQGVIANALRALEQECRGTGKETHLRLFQARVVGPVLQGEPQPSLETLAHQLGLDCKDVANRLGTAKRAFARLLTQEVRAYASGEDEVSLERTEIMELLRID
jgi:RNA polymerase sigma-70 factor (ECF subfamily)